MQSFVRTFGCNLNTMISKEALEEYKAIWRKENPGQDIDDQTAMDEATALLTIMDKVYRPITKEELGEYNKKNKKEAYIRCKKCGTEIYWNTHKKMTPCACGAISVDGTDGYIRTIGNKEDYEQIQK